MNIPYTNNQNMVYMVRLSVDHVTKDIYNNRFRDFLFIHLFLMTLCPSKISLCFATIGWYQLCFYTFHLFLNIVKAKKVILFDNKCQITLLFFILELHCYACHFLVFWFQRLQLNNFALKTYIKRFFYLKMLVPA